MRQLPQSVRFAVLGMVAQSPRGTHGYALKRQCDRVLGHFWQINLGEVYRVLDRLSFDGLVEAVRGQPGSNRKVHRITRKGQRSLDEFILQPPTDVPRPLRQELAVKLLFGSPTRVPELAKLISTQRDTYMQQLHLLGIQRRKLARAASDSFVTSLLIDGAELTVRAELAWLDHVCHKLIERFGSPA
ncbi:MAG: PadR family transcriptional regulator [Candidatus Binatia bacterium]